MSDLVRIESDSMGELRIPIHALWGAQTQRAIENFPVSGLRFSREFIAALGWIKRACAEANHQLRLLPPDIIPSVLTACDEVVNGQLDVHFPLDIFQTGSGTSTNMNANEVIANRAIQLSGGRIGSKFPVHPNDHVNASQSSNDVIPTTIHVAAVVAINNGLRPSLARLCTVMRDKSEQFDHIIKIGRTHLQDAVPIRLGQEFGGYATQIAKSLERIDRAADCLREVPLGGTAVGTGLNRLPEFPRIALDYLNAYLNESFHEAMDHFESNAARDACVEVSGLLRTIAVTLTKIANDVRWLGSGPRNGLGELRIPPVQPGSSIMPGKVNPVICESVLMVAAHVIGSDLSVTLGGLSGNFELNVMMPLIAHHLIQSISLLHSASDIFTQKCLAGLEADEQRCQEMAENNLANATALTPHIGYDRAVEVCKIAVHKDLSIRQAADQIPELTPEALDRILSLRKLTEPGIPGYPMDNR